MRLGADPEVFLMNDEGKHISAIGLIRADKWNPLQINGMAKGFTLQEDNVALEYGIPPADCAEQFVAYIESVMKKSREWTLGLDFSKVSATVFEKDQLEHPLAHVFGCEPDFDAWTGKENRKPTAPNPGLRSAGGHVHVETKQEIKSVIRRMDLFLGVPSVLMDIAGAERRQLYGGRGAYRPKPYGGEYRTLSNFWIFDPKLIEWVWNSTARALAAPEDVADYLHSEIEEAINNGNVQVAQALVNEYQLEIV